MRQLLDMHCIQQIPDAAMRSVIRQRYDELMAYGLPFAEMAVFWLIEPSDSPRSISEQTGLPIMHGRNPKHTYPDAQFVPAWDVLQGHAGCFEMVFVTSDSGYGQVLWIAMQSADPALLKLCIDYAQ